MSKAPKNSSKRTVVILACVLFVCVTFSGMANAAERTPSTKLPAPQEHLSLFSPLFALMSSNFSLFVSDPATVISLFIIDPIPLSNPDKDKADSKSQKDNNLIKTLDNSTSTKPANGKD